jgi:hypothetical protein
VFFGSLSQFSKVRGLLVTGFDLQMCQLSGFLAGQKNNQSLKLGCRFLGLVSAFQH